MINEENVTSVLLDEIIRPLENLSVASDPTTSAINVPKHGHPPTGPASSCRHASNPPTRHPRNCRGIAQPAIVHREGPQPRLRVPPFPSMVLAFDPTSNPQVHDSSFLTGVYLKRTSLGYSGLWRQEASLGNTSESGLGKDPAK